MITVIMQGDAYDLPFNITNSNGEKLSPDEVSDVEIKIGSLKKTYAAEEITVSEDDEWLFPLTQSETLALPEGFLGAQIRIKYTSNDVIGMKLGWVRVQKSSSRAVL